MTKALVALGAFVATISLSIFAFAALGQAPLITTIESPDKTYLVHLNGKKSRPAVPLIMHSVYFDLFRQGKPIVRGRKLHSGDWFDPAFDDLYSQHAWANSSTLKFYRQSAPDANGDTLNVTNNASKAIKFLRLQSTELFLLFDLKSQARAKLSASPQTWLSWIAVEGEFEDGTSIPRKGINFKIDPSLKGPFTYEIAISDDGPTISSSHLPVYISE